MGSLRNPIGPLPSSIYWRRRAVLLSVVGLLLLLVVWALASGGGGGDNGADGPSGNGPATSITPGPSGSGPAISEHPGGRDESEGEGDGDGSGDGSGDSEGSGSGGSDSGGGSGGSGGSDDAKGGGGSGARLPAGSPLAKCTSGAVQLKLRSVRNSYAPGQKPKLELTAVNSGGKACKVDLGGKGTVVTITLSGADDAIWSSNDCPGAAASLLFKVPANGHVTHSLEWDRKASAPQCATPPAGGAKAGTYLVEARATGLGSDQASFVLTKD
ncbi:hypothetical protein [Streptomyces flavofungini]|uniref:Uncharacterized protein n=1 Tax=Streptomyces flavofungini TaxID=68200 RepID=A0ABS0XHS0_9ACTN|nr:hypothetical protein [Streptomyces flavofungini]MBJ3812449.1 hypothetical protein [Streptomyces flavofungini]GHC73720.1 hypothetical protein GCM10010349_51710 [Streptomyces flavofungini]